MKFFFDTNKKMMDDGVPEAALPTHDKTRKTATSTRGSRSLRTHSTNGTDESLKSQKKAIARSRSVLMGRVVFVGILVVVAVVLGFFSFALLNRAEKRLIQDQYDSMMDRALEVTRQLAVRRVVPCYLFCLRTVVANLGWFGCCHCFLFRPIDRIVRICGTAANKVFSR